MWESNIDPSLVVYQHIIFLDMFLMYYVIFHISVPHGMLRSSEQRVKAD